MISTIHRARYAKGMYLHLQAKPASQQVSISYSLLKDSGVEISIYNQQGQRLNTLFKDFQKSGKHNLEWDSSHLNKGIYFFYLKGGGRQLVKKISVGR